MKRLLILALLLMTAAISAQTAFAAPSAGQCSGVLHKTDDQLMFGGGKGEDEGIYIVRKADEAKVLAVCAVGKFCRVRGTVDDCTDSGECSELTSITTVRKK